RPRARAAILVAERLDRVDPVRADVLAEAEKHHARLLCHLGRILCRRFGPAYSRAWELGTSIPLDPGHARRAPSSSANQGHPARENRARAPAAPQRPLTKSHTIGTRSGSVPGTVRR